MWALRERERETERDTETQRERKKERHTEPERENKRDRERETERLPPEHNGSIRHIPLLQHMRRNIRVELSEYMTQFPNLIIQNEKAQMCSGWIPACCVH